MFGIEVQFVSNGRRVLLDDVVDLVAGKVGQRVVLELQERLVQPTPQSRADLRAKGCERTGLEPNDA